MAFHNFIRAMLEGEPITIYGDGNQSRDFTYVTDVVAANLLSMKKETKHKTYNIVGWNHLTVNDVIHVLKELMEVEVEVLFKEKAKGDVRDTSADTSRSKEELRFKPEYNLAYGLKKEIEWIKEIYSL